MLSRECCHHSSSIKPTFNESSVGRRLRRDEDIAPYRLRDYSLDIRRDEDIAPYRLGKQDAAFDRLQA